jgi:hypothetical protein
MTGDWTIRPTQFGLFGSVELWVKVPIPWSAPLRRPTVSAIGGNDKGQDKFYSFYRYFLLRLFHEGLGGKARNPELDKLLGRIPYLNGGLFEQHPIEERCPEIKIPDEAFTRMFAYFDRYQWHLDERPLRNDTEINPDVLGYIFEKYINQKQMGAYYTKEDITEYISKNTVIPFLFDAAKAKCKVAFENPGGPTIWDHLRDDPDRYIHQAWGWKPASGRGRGWHRGCVGAHTMEPHGTCRIRFADGNLARGRGAPHPLHRGQGETGRR